MLCSHRMAQEEEARQGRERELIELYNQESEKVRSDINIEDYGYREHQHGTRYDFYQLKSGERLYDLQS